AKKNRFDNPAGSIARRFYNWTGTVFESLSTSTSKVRFDEKKTVKKQNAAHTSTIGHVSTEEGSKSTASSPPEAAPKGKQPKTEEKAAGKT
ncbi:Uncharacterized protein APZ42_000948, partial [Daphnia magna]